MIDKAKILLAPDYAKAFGIALVVFGHTLRGLLTAGVIPEDPLFSAIDRLVYLFHMPLFFYISGLFIQSSLKNKNLGNFIKHMFFVLLVPMAVWSYLQSSLQYFASGYANTHLEIMGVLFAPFPPQQQFWFLGALFLMSVGTAALIKRNLLQTLLWPLIVITLVVQAIVWEETMALVQGRPLYHLLTSTFLFWPYFLLGIGLGTDELRKSKMPNFVCVFLFCASLFLYQYYDVLEGPLHACMSVLCILCVYKISLNIEEKSSPAASVPRLVAFVGMNSMIIYLAHVIFSAGFRAIALRLGIDDGSVHLVGGFLAGMVGPVLLVPVGLIMAKKHPVLAQSVLPVRANRRT